MTLKYPTSITLAAALFPFVVHAQTRLGDGTDSRLSQLFWSSLPLIIVAGIIFLLIRFAAAGKRVKTYEDYRERHMQHMERVEQTLEQIRQALEKRP
jgi:hypothetical protein